MNEKAFDKKFKSLMTKTKLKGMFKKVDTLDECDVVLVMYYNPKYDCSFVIKKEFKEEKLPDEDYAVRYLKYSNPRHTTNKLPRKLLGKACF